MTQIFFGSVSAGPSPIGLGRWVGRGRGRGRGAWCGAHTAWDLIRASPSAASAGRCVCSRASSLARQFLLDARGGSLHFRQQHGIGRHPCAGGGLDPRMVSHCASCPARRVHVRPSSGQWFDTAWRRFGEDAHRFLRKSRCSRTRASSALSAQISVAGSARSGVASPQ